jgi:glutamate-1-semialdehyde 2,1-aminomutase
VAVSAGLATLDLLKPDLYQKIEATSAALEAGLVRAAESRGIAARVQRVGSMLTVFFRSEPVRSWSDAAASDTKRFAAWHAALLAGGVYWPPSQFEAAFVSAAHDADDVAKTLDVATAAFAKAKA